MEEVTNWPQFAYQYIVGGIFFFVTLYLCFRPGASDPENPSDRRALKYLLVGFVGYALVHAAWVLFATYV
jgi:hypothetical protein